MTFRRISALVTQNQEPLLWRPSLYRACVIGNKDEYIEIEKKIMDEYRKVNKIGDDDE